MQETMHTARTYNWPPKYVLPEGLFTVISYGLRVLILEQNCLLDTPYSSCYGEMHINIPLAFVVCSATHSTGNGPHPVVARPVVGYHIRIRTSQRSRVRSLQTKFDSG